jgi:DNA topoisomerase II
MEIEYDKNADISIDRAFGNTEIIERKEWIRNFDSGTRLERKSNSIISISEFVEKELILYFIEDVIKNVPSFIDGLNVIERSILFHFFKKNYKKEKKVTKLASCINEGNSIDYRELELSDSIVKMAQNFVGSNNINLLHPGGLFGTRMEGGNDSASPGYIFTELSKLTRFIFPLEDDIILSYLEMDGMNLEPSHLIPIIPMILVK